jgi:hypothetical protein
VVLDIDFQGDEIPETTTRIRRRVWADDPGDLSSALHYEVIAIEWDDGPQDPELQGLSPSAKRVLAVLESDADWRAVKTIGDALAEDSTGLSPLKARTIQTALQRLVEAELVETKSILGSSGGQWRSIRAHSPEIEARNAF